MGWPVCNSTSEDETITEVDLWDGGITFHQLCLIMGGAFGLMAILVSFYLIGMHATHYSKKIEQRHIIRILLMVPVYSVVAWLGTYFYKNDVYYDLIGNCYEAFAISAFFSLMCAYIAPDLHSQKEYFRGVEPKPWVWPIPWLQKCTGGEKGIWRTPRSGLTWFNVIWVGVFQYCLLRVLMTIIAVVTQKFNLYCEESLNPAFSHIWVLLIECIAVSIAMYCLIQFYIQIKDDISQYQPFLKILSIKLVIFLSFWQSTLISFLTSAGAIKTTSRIQSPDLKVGLPNLLINIEMAFFAVLHLWAFSWKQYSLKNQPSEITDFYGNGKGSYEGGPFGAKGILDALNPMDLIRAIGRSFRWLFVGRKRRTMDPSYHQTANDAFNMNATESGIDSHGTEYGGAGVMMAGGRYSPPGEEGQVLLSHAQPSPGGPPPPIDDETDPNRFYNHNRLSAASLLEPTATHTARPYSPYEEDAYNPYLVNSHLEQDHYHEPVHANPPYPDHPSDINNPYHPTTTLQEQPPIPLPESYQPPPPNYDSDHQQQQQQRR
ncbi:hypothetical protein CBS147343_176 [Aspergillus niger]|nr:hypothetical protein CBS12448_730 [Aspergillus niger]KAI2923653.1 hypothetical protein CBS147371_1495 [Aspergillus niger]KAI2934993.1 hypothetical protein CBS147320_727 [Aspergillus niger]KAI2953614.1 hypothetical protein CBS147321_458 [Aspergillus niger]KAI2960735.1 hypothetical protein CBS147322_700 [Aspergillus niger]